MKTGATFDRTKKYRYLLWREWEASLPTCAFIMLNPSTADATTNDPTIRRAIAFAQKFGYGKIEAVNLFAYRATESDVLKRVRNPVGKDNDRFILEALDRADACFVAWGHLGTLAQRSEAVLRLIPEETQIHCLGVTKSGEPRHPLYLPNATMPMLFQRAPIAADDIVIPVTRK